MSNSPPKGTTALLSDTRQLCGEYMNAVMSLALDAARDPAYGTNNLLVLAIEDHLEASVSLPEMASRGLVNTCRRELRFPLEASIKLCYVEHALPSGSIDDKLASLRSALDSPNIGLRNHFELPLLPQDERVRFSAEVGRLYGQTSNYVHLTFAQVEERDRLIRQGAQPLTPSEHTIEPLLGLMSRVLAASFVYIAHAVPAFAVGDLLVRENGYSHSWALSGHRWIALLDEYFDYKQERRANIDDIRRLRWNRVTV
jgi:hypothetical protein